MWKTWALTPIVVDTLDGDRVHSFLALNQGAAFEANLQAVWYIKDTEYECSWYALTWDTSDPWDAIKTVKVSLGISDDDDPNWAVSVESTAWSEPKELFDYSAGFMADDGLGRAINTLPDRDEWVAWLVDIGYKAAEIKFEKAVESTDPAYPSTVLSQYAGAVEKILAQGPIAVAPGSTPMPMMPPPPIPAPGNPRPPRVVPGPNPTPVDPASLPGGPLPPPYFPPAAFCCTPSTFRISQYWSGYIPRGPWSAPVNCGPSVLTSR